MLKMYFLYKTTNRVNGRVFYGVYASEDIFFGTEFAEDKYCGQNAELMRDVKALGRHNFSVEALHAFPIEAAAHLALERYSPKSDYKHGNIGAQFEQSRRDKISAALKGERNGSYGVKPSEETRKKISIQKGGTRWINDGERSRQIPKGDPTPEGWNDGRPKSLAEKVRKTQRLNYKSDQ